MPWRTIFNETVRFASPDSYYFAIGVRANAVDPTVHYIRLLYNFSKLSPFDYEIDIIIFTLIVHLATLPAVYYLAKMLLGPGQANIAVLIFAILPGEYLGRSLIGNIDYHSTEVLLTTMGLLGIVAGLKARRSQNKVIFILAGMVAVFFYSLIWAGYYLFAPVLTLFGLFLLWRVVRYYPLLTLSCTLGGLVSVGTLIQKALQFPSKIWQGTLEAKPLLIDPVPLFSLLSVVIVCAGIIVSFLEYRRTKENKLILLIIWSAVIVGATLLQRRFDYYLAVNASLMVSYLIYKTFSFAGTQKLKYTAAATYIICLALLPVSVRIGSEVSHAPLDDWVEALEWIEDNTPEDAVIGAWWDYGYWIEYIAQRQAVVHPGQDPQGIKQVANILTADNIQGVDYLIIDSKTMNQNYSAVEFRAKRSGQKSAARRLWSGEEITGVEMVYGNETVRVYLTKP